MGQSNYLSFSLFFYVLVLVNIVGHVTYAQDSQADYLKGQNAVRSEVNVPNLVWNDTVAAYAQSYANKRKDCQLEHSSGGDGTYGENIAMSTGEMFGTDAVSMWVGEKPHYDYNSNSCIGGECGHYTQVVWRNTTSIGCAKVRCDNGGTFITCNYYPPGNYLGDRPY